MSSFKLQSIGNSLGFRFPKESLKSAGFHLEDEYEYFTEEGVIYIVKRLPHHSQWSFKSPKLSSEDKAWVESEL